MNPLLRKALEYHQAGVFDRAEAIYLELIQSNPQNFEALHLLGVIASQVGDHSRAVECIGRAIQLSPDNPNFHFNLGISLEELGRFREAADCFGVAGLLKIDYADAFLNRGNCLYRMGDPVAAMGAYDQAIKAYPACASAHSNLGNILHEMGRFDDALVSHLQAVEIDPHSAPYHFNLGNLLKELNQLEEALESYENALRLNPRYWVVLGNKGAVLMDLGRYEEALLSYETAIALRSNDSKSFSNRGSALVALKRFDEAIQSFGRAIELDPDDSQTCMNFGNALVGAGKVEAAIDYLFRAVSINPGSAEAFSNLGSALKLVGRFDEAFASFDRAINLVPGLAEAHLNKGLTQLLLGDFKDGLGSYEWRWKANEQRRSRREFEQPLWTGQESLVGKTILLHSEQGLGDTIQFCRYIPLLAARGARVFFELPQALYTLLESLPGVALFIIRGEALPPVDFHCPLMSVPLAFETTLLTIPSFPSGYLQANSAKLATWSGRLGQRTKPRIGLVWSGNSKHSNDRNRSIQLSSFLSYLPRQFDYVSLQKEVNSKDQSVLDQKPAVSHFGSELEEFTDTAALCALMDLVVSVDTSVAHLSGALGKPTWILIPRIPDWRWLLGRDDSPWYPTVKLYRQGSAGAWDPVLNRVRDDLLAFDPA